MAAITPAEAMEPDDSELSYFFHLQDTINRFLKDNYVGAGPVFFEIQAGDLSIPMRQSMIQAYEQTGWNAEYVVDGATAMLKFDQKKP